MRRPLRGDGKTKPTHPLATSFVAPRRALLSEGLQEAADAEQIVAQEQVTPTEEAAVGDYAPRSHEDQPMQDGNATAEQAAEDSAPQHQAGAHPSAEEEEEEEDPPPPAPANGEIAPLPVSDASALNLFLDAADYLDWELPVEAGRQAAAEHANDTDAGGNSHAHASLTDSMGAMLEAQRLLANRMEGEHAGEEAGEGASAGEKSGWQEHVALLMGLGQSGGTNAEATAQETSEHVENDAEQAYDHDEMAPPAKRGRGGRRGGRSRGTAVQQQGQEGGDLPEGEAGPSQRTGTKEVLSEEQKKANHIRSEQRRRNAIKIGYTELGCLEHISVNIPWPSGEQLVDEVGQIRDDPGVHIEGRLMPTVTMVKTKRKRGEGADATIDGDEGSPVEEPVYKKPAPNKVAKGWSKNAVLQKGASLSRWLREGNQWLAAEVARLEKLLEGIDDPRPDLDAEQYQEGGHGGSAAVVEQQDGQAHQGLEEIDPALRSESLPDDGAAAA